MPNSIKTRVLEIFGQHVKEPSEIDKVANSEPILVATTIDSLTLVHIVVDLEREFDLQFGPDDLEDVFYTIDTLVAYIERNEVPDSA